MRTNHTLRCSKGSCVSEKSLTLLQSVLLHGAQGGRVCSGVCCFSITFMKILQQAKEVVEVYSTSNDFQLTHIVFIIVTSHFLRTSQISENCSISMLGLLPPTSQFKASWWIDIFVVEKKNMVITNIHSGLLSVVSFVLGNFCTCAGHHPQMVSCRQRSSSVYKVSW